MLRRLLDSLLAPATLFKLFNNCFLLRQSIGSRGDGCKQAADEPAVLRVVAQMVD